jgi:1-acyl-sn-glycerol-3-phosphate acyltransferase
MKSLRAAWRLLRVLVHLVSGAWTIRRRFGALDFEQRQQQIQAWSRQLLELIGVRLLVHGELPAGGPLLVVANHISWLDIVVIDAALPCRFVSKADVRHWPLIGPLVAGSGTLFIERDRRRDAMRVVHQMAERLQAGDRLGVFPEGTTGDGSSLLPFHANLLQAAVATDTPVLLLGLQYTDERDGRRHDGPTYVGDTSLLTSLWRTLAATGLQAELHVGELDSAQGRDRRTWAEALRRDLAQRLDLPLPG